MAVINIGPGALDKPDTAASGSTYIDTLVAYFADGTGTLSQIELWFTTDATGVKCGPFWKSDKYYQGAGETIGNVSSGSKQTFSGLSLNVYTGQQLGIYFATGTLDAEGEVDASDYIVGDYFGAGSFTGTQANDQRLSIFATGTTGTPASTAPSMTTSDPSPLGTTTATGNGTVVSNGGEVLTERGVCWNLTGTPTTSDSKSLDNTNSEGDFTKSMTALKPSTLYYTRAYAINSVGTGYGNQITFRAMNTVTIP